MCSEIERNKKKAKKKKKRGNIIKTIKNRIITDIKNYFEQEEE